MRTGRDFRALSEQDAKPTVLNAALFWVLVPLFVFSCATSAANNQTSKGHPAPVVLDEGGVAQSRAKLGSIRMPLVDGRDIKFRAIHSVNSLSQTRATPTVQDHLGFLWFGTQYGLNRFDGYRFKVFRHEPGRPNSLSGVYVRTLFVDHSGTLWVSCDQSLDRFDPVTETFTHFRLGREGTNENYGPAIHISEDPSGKLWLATFKGLFMLDPVDGQTIRYTHDPNDPASLSANDINFCDEDRKGQFWVASGAGLDAFDRRTGKVTQHILFDEHYSFMFHEDTFGVFWIVRTSPQCPLATLNRKDSKLTCYAFYDGANRVTSIAGGLSMLESQEGTVWVSTEGAGLLKYDRARNRIIRYIHHPEDIESLGSNSANDLFEDREGNIWVDMHESVPYFFSERPPPFETFTHQRGELKGSLVSSIYVDRRQVIWIGTTGALNRIDRANGTNTVSPGVGVKGEVLSILEDRSGRLVAGTFRPGLQELDPETGRAKPYLHRPGVRSNDGDHPIMRLLIDHLGTLWAATWGGLRRLNMSEGNFTTYKPDPSAEVDYSDIKEDKDGKFWLGGESGLQRFDPTTGQFTVYKHDPDDAHSVSDHRVTSVFFDRSGRMWLGTQDGFDSFDPNTGKTKVYYEKDGLAGNVVSCILEDERGSLWMGTNNGLSNFDPLTERFKNFSVADGLPGPDLTGWSSCFKTPQGEMFFGGFSGATAFYPSRVTTSSFIPTTVLTDFRLSGFSVTAGPGSPLSKSITYTHSITLSHQQNAFAIEFSALSNFNAETNRYRYKLEGLDKQWYEVGSDQRVASYTTLPKGKYTFRVQGATSRGAWSEPGASLEVIIAPPWWETLTARLLAMVVIATSLFLLDRRRKHVREERVKVRIEAQVTERTRVAREIHDTLLQSFQGVILAFEGAALGLSKDNSVRAELERTLKRAEATICEGRDAIHRLRDSSSSKVSLPEAIRAFGEGEAALSEPEFELSVIGLYSPLPWDQEVELLLIAKEALHNAFKHSRARRVTCTLTASAHDTSIVLRDDGTGIPPVILSSGGRADHWGLRGMRERAEQIGATLQITSAPGEGTIISLSIRHPRKSRANR